MTPLFGTVSCEDFNGLAERVAVFTNFGRIHAMLVSVDVIPRAELLAFMRQERYAVQASTSCSGEPQAAIVGIVVSEHFEVFFDTLDTSRKAANLRRNPSVAFVIGPVLANSARTVQLEGTADEPTGPELERLLKLYFATFPDGKAQAKLAGVNLLSHQADVDPVQQLRGRSSGDC